LQSGKTGAKGNVSFRFIPLSTVTLTQLLLLLATLAFAGGAVHAFAALKAGRWHESRWQWVLILAGFALQTAFLYWRGREVGQCPMKSLPDILVFISWSMVLLYFLVGSAYRLSLLGVFTGPMVAGLLALSTVLPGAFEAYPAKAKIVALVELHVAVALVAYAAFAMAAVTGVMYLLQERMLKSHRIGQMFFQLPPIRELARAILRLVLLGLGLLSVALGLTFALEPSVAVTGSKVVFAWGVWGLYAVIAVLMWRHVMSPRRMAWLAVAGFALPFVSLWIVS
jgi:HemX protein